ncbi:MAG TPA: hypothetical protein VJ839_08010 [Candidatus Limnocylindria bacterium]|nr:hypothetical protein [Candidatus Limnocylindria bacterium]
MRLVRLIPISMATLLVLAPVVVAGGTSGTVAGYYNYRPTGEPPGRTLVVQATGGWFVKGTWVQLNPDTGAVARSGAVTCLVTDGNDAWLAGPELFRASGLDARAGVFLHIHGPRPGEGDDAAVTWFGDPGQPLSEMVGWCRNRNADLPLFPLVHGDVDVLP